MRTWANNQKGCPEHLGAYVGCSRIEGHELPHYWMETRWPRWTYGWIIRLGRRKLGIKVRLYPPDIRFYLTPKREGA